MAGGALATAFVRVEADDKPFLTTVDKSGKTASSNLNKTMTAGGTSSGKKYGDTFSKSALPYFGSLGKAGSLALAGGAIAGVAGLTAVFKTGFDEVADYQKGLAQTNAVLASTHGVAGVTAKSVEGLASSIQSYSGQTDDSIVAGEDLLLTFTNIRNAAGQGNDVFNQSTKILADMSQALGEDTSNAAIQLGKALNDPINGITALRRVGVSFTQEQRDQIKAMVDAGDTMGAQKVILGELNKEFGGSAAAFGKTLPGEIARGKRAFEDFSQALVTDLIPVINLTFEGISGVAHILGGTVHFFESNHDAAAALGAVLAVALIPRIAMLITQFAALGLAKIGMAFESATAGAGGLAGAAKNVVASINPITVVAAAAAFAVVRSWEAQKKAVAEGKQEADDYVKSINVIPTSLASLVQATGLVTNKFDEQRAVVSDLVKQGDFASNNWAKQVSALNEYGHALDEQKAKQQAATANEAALSKQYGLTREQIEQIATGANIDLRGSTDLVTSAFRKQYEVVEKTHHPMSQGAKDMAKVGDTAVSAADQISALNAALDELAGKSISADEASNTFKIDIIDLTAEVRAAHGDFSGTSRASLELRNQFSGAATQAIALANAQKAAGASNKTIKSTLDASIQSLEKAGGDNAYVRGEVAKLKAAEDKLLPSVKDVNKALNSVPSNPYNGVIVPGTGGSLGVRRSAVGGYITGPGTKTSDSILSLLSNGEFVMSAAAVDALGVPLLNALNTGNRALVSQLAGPLGTGSHRFTTPKLRASSVTSTASSADALLAQQNQLLNEQNGLLRAYLPAIGGDVAHALNSVAAQASHAARTQVRRR